MTQPSTDLYRTIWRWHFYAGLFVVPMVLLLALTGAIYLFKPQVEAWEERAWRDLPTAGAVSPDAQVRAALAALPGARFHSYRLPRAEADAVLVHLGLPGDGHKMRDVFVSPQGKVVGMLDPEWRIMQVAHDLHGQLLIGKPGSWIVELAASWAIVMILTGLYLWWPTGGGLAGVAWPRFSNGRKVLWRDLHAVTGFWVSGLAMVLLLTGLPWADVWGSAFKAVRTELGWIKGEQDWTIGGKPVDGGEHAEHDHAAMMQGQGAAMPVGAHMMPDGTIMTAAPITLSRIVAEAKGQHLPFPVVVTPPGAPQRFGGKAKSEWTVRSDTQNRPQRVTISYDPMTGAERSRETFANKHVIDRVVGYGVAWHEGALLGWINQLIGVLTAAMLMALSLTAFVMWRRRKPQDRLGAPPHARGSARHRGVTIIVLVLAALLPLLALSLVAMLAIERLVLRRIAPLAQWLGLAAAGRRLPSG
ncbi:PepSY domain-containing protein [Novosphingobium sp.]|uniref:PepSY-associated TM helix domain-containing protein n=1 Tax=Novosphingobium sp. TaxID=1874826 RepID=UPI0025EB3050|nr:PepSY domain-containing protein [Novosphingobium sp.]MCC6926447.1 PepSY domain-containing protein [Novosphingobium sp.]